MSAILTHTLLIRHEDNPATWPPSITFHASGNAAYADLRDVFAELVEEHSDAEPADDADLLDLLRSYGVHAWVDQRHVTATQYVPD